MKNGSWRLAVTAGAALALVTACGNDTSESPPSKPPVSLASASSASADPIAIATEAALAAYRGMWTAYIQGGRTQDPQDDQIGRYAEGDALAALQAGLEYMRQKGLVTKGDVVMNPRVVELAPPGVPESIELRDCLDTTDSSLVKESPAGLPYIDSPGGRRDVTATAKSSGGVWKIISFVPLDVGTC